jgi:hypothetical protein
MQPGAGRKFEAVGDIVDDSSDSVRPVEMGPKLPLGDHV